MKKFLGRALYYFVRTFALVVLTPIYPRIVTNKKYLQTGTPRIVVANHLSGWDPIFLALELIPSMTYIMGKSELFKNKFLGWCLLQLGGFPVDRGKPDLRSIKRSIECLKGNTALEIFPEGTRNKDNPDEFLEFHGGIALVALKAKAKVVPVYFANTKGYKPFRPIHMRVGKPLDLDDLYDQNKVSNDMIALVMQRLRQALLDLKENRKDI